MEKPLQTVPTDRETRLRGRDFCVDGRDALKKHLPTGCPFEAKELSEKPLFLGGFTKVVWREGKTPSETKASSFLLLEKACLSADREFPGGRSNMRSSTEWNEKRKLERDQYGLGGND
jgi:hypothetical protein